MITKERLEELIRQGAIIYGITDDEELVEIKCEYLHHPKLLSSGELCREWCVVYDRDGGSCVFTVNFDFSNIFETKEDAEFALKYQNITRTETLNLPTFEEFCKYEYIDFLTSKGKHCWLEICLESPTSRFRMAEGSMFTHIWDLTKENYLEACELCKKLFLGEEE